MKQAKRYLIQSVILLLVTISIVFTGRASAQEKCLALIPECGYPNGPCGDDEEYIRNEGCKKLASRSRTIYYLVGGVIIVAAAGAYIYKMKQIKKSKRRSKQSVK